VEDNRPCSLRDLIRERRKKEKGSRNQEIEILESKVRAAGKIITPKHLQQDELGDWVTIISDSDDGSFVIKEKILLTASQLVQRTMSLHFLERRRKEIRLPFNSNIIEFMLGYMTADYVLNGATQGNNGARQRIAVELQPQYVLEMLMASEYLEVDEFSELICSMLADHIGDIPSFEGISPESLARILSKVNPFTLCEWELRPDTQEIEFDTSDLWTKHYELLLGKCADDESVVFKRLSLERSFQERLAVGGSHKMLILDLANIAGTYVHQIHLDLAVFKGTNIDMEQFFHLLPNLNQLSLSGNIQHFDLLASNIVKGISKNTIRCFKLTNSRITPQQLRLVLTPMYQTLESLVLSGNKLNSEIGQIVAEFLVVAKSLSYLDLSSNDLQDLRNFPTKRVVQKDYDGINSILFELMNCKSLKILNMSDYGLCCDNLKKESLASLAESSLTTLNLSYNSLFSSQFSENARMFWAALATMKDLSRLQLSECGLKVNQVKDMALFLDPLHFPATRLKHLDLSSNMITENCQSALVELISNHPLESLDLSQNDLARSLDKLSTAICIHPSLRDVSFRLLQYPSRHSTLHLIDVITSCASCKLERLDIYNNYPTERESEIVEFNRQYSIMQARKPQLKILI